jgi:hypothetical protein
MQYIEKKDGYVYMVVENSVDGRFKTYYNLGKDPDSPMWIDEVKEMKINKKTKKEGKK